MFIPVNFPSVNRKRDALPGTYAATCACYGGEANWINALLFEYTLAGAALPTVCDLMLIDVSGALRARDFVWMPDRSWRDSDGARANDLASLLPAELLALPFTEQRRLPDVVVPRTASPPPAGTATD